MLRLNLDEEPSLSDRRECMGAPMQQSCAGDPVIEGLPQGESRALCMTEQRSGQAVPYGSIYDDRFHTSCTECTPNATPIHLLMPAAVSRVPTKHATHHAARVVK